MIDGLVPYPAYKGSALPWIGRIPQHWEEKRAKYLFREVDDRSDSGTEELLSVSHITGVTPRSQKNVTMFMAESTVGYKVCRPGDLVINTMWAWMGALGVSALPGLVSPAYGVYRPRSNTALSPGFAGLLLRLPQYVNEYTCRSTGIQSSRLRLYPEQFLEIPLACPPVDEQALIARFVAHVDRRIRRYVRTKTKLIALLNEQKAAIIQRAMTRGIARAVRLKPSGVEWLGEIPEHWEVRRAKAVCTAIVDCKNRTPQAVENGDFLVVRTTCIRNARFDPAGGYQTNRENYEKWTSRGAPRLGDVFFTREAPAGEACLVPENSDLCMGQRMMYFRPDTALIDPRFLLLNIYGPLAHTYVELATNGSTVGHLRLGQVFALPILWCPVEEQIAILRHVDRTTTPLDAALAAARRGIELLRESRTRLIADVVTGQLDVREAAGHLPDESDESDPIAETDAGPDENADAEDAELDIASEDAVS